MNVVIPGAGTNGFSFMGGLYSLISITKKSIKRFNTTSSGSLVALMYILSYTEEEIITLIKEEKWYKMTEYKIFQLISKGFLVNWSEFDNIVKKIIRQNLLS